MSMTGLIWVARDYMNCSGCRLCEVACSLRHEGKIWPEASRIRVFMHVPTLEIPHFCAQCDNPPCVPSCPTNALSISNKTGAILVDAEKCVGCGVCIDACPGRVPFMHPATKKAVICDLCDGEPQCSKVCQEARYNALWTVRKSPGPSYKLYAKLPEKVTEELARRMYRDFAERLV